MDPPAAWDGETDVIVVGAGAAGLNRTARAATRGAKVVLIDKGVDLGGSAKYSTVAAAFGSHIAARHRHQ